jgi:hypothetical protein
LGCRYAVSAYQGKQSDLASGEKKKRKKCYWIMKNKPLQFVIMEWKMNESGSRIGYYLKHLSDK